MIGEPDAENAREIAGGSLKFEAYCPRIERRERLMSHPQSAALKLNSVHCRAICEEVGERLRILLDREAGAIPPRLQLLVHRLAELDCEAPSIVPAMDDMAACAVAA
jgi:hypothetical protein